MLAVTLADEQAFRGAQIHVEGRASVAGKPLADHAVDVFLAPPGRDGSGSILLGRAVTGADGMFRADFAVPATVAPSAYEIWLSSTEDAYFNAALSQ